MAKRPMELGTRTLGAATVSGCYMGAWALFISEWPARLYPGSLVPLGNAAFATVVSEPRIRNDLDSVQEENVRSALIKSVPRTSRATVFEDERTWQYWLLAETR
jgi:hypothetical protein